MASLIEALKEIGFGLAELFQVRVQEDLIFEQRNQPAADAVPGLGFEQSVFPFRFSVGQNEKGHLC